MAIEIHSFGASVGHLRQEAKRLAKADAIPLNLALDRTAHAFAVEQGWALMPDEKLSWEQLISNIWRLDGNGVLISEWPAIGIKQAARAELVQRPWPVRLEIACECLAKDRIFPLVNVHGHIVSHLPTQSLFSSYFDMKARLERSIDANGVIVQRLRVSRHLRCLDGDDVRCSCCKRIELGYCDARLRETYNDAIATGSLTKMAAWAVGFLHPSVEVFGPAHEDYEWLSTTEEVEARLEVMASLEDGPFGALSEERRAVQ